MEARKSFLRFLKICSCVPTMKDWHIIFHRNTVVRLTPEMIKTAPKNFDYYLGSDFPEHLFADHDEIETIKRENLMQMQKTIRQCVDDTRFSDAIYAGYAWLIGDGYPYPGGEGADRNVEAIWLNDENFEEESHFFFVTYPARTFYIFNLADAWDNPKIGKGAYGANERRQDFMFPKIELAFTPEDLLRAAKFE